MLERLRRCWKRFNELYDQLFFVPYRSAVARERRDQQELFMLMLFSDMLGIPNPLSYYTLELMPVMLEEFHAWHQRQGMERSPYEGIRCC